MMKSLKICDRNFRPQNFQRLELSQKAFTEQGVYMLVTILKSKTATKVTVAIMRAFVKLRHFTLTYEDIVKKTK
jgi:hypothetical protein